MNVYNDFDFLGRNLSTTENVYVGLSLNSFKIYIREILLEDVDSSNDDYGIFNEVDFSLSTTLLDTICKFEVNEKVPIDKYVEYYDIVDTAYLKFEEKPKFYLIRVNDNLFKIEIMLKFPDAFVVDVVHDVCIKKTVDFKKIIDVYESHKEELEAYKKKLDA